MFGAVEKMRGYIQITFKSGWGESGSPPAFEVGFHGRDPVKVRDVTAALGNIFLEENLRLREQQAANTSKFLEGELEKVKDDLRQWEDKVRRFKEKHAGLLPEEMENNYRILTQLQQHLDSINTAIQKTEDRRLLLQTQLSKLNSLSDGSSVAGGKSEEPMTLDGLRRRLQTLQTRYSDRHPDVIKLKAMIAKLESQHESGHLPKEPGKSDGQTSSGNPQTLVHFEKEDRSTELRIIDKEIFSLRTDKIKTEGQIEQYRQRIEMGPKIEAQFVDLRRGYEQASANYQSLLEKKLQADLSENLEQTQKGEQFKIQDRAYLPQKPFKPNIRRILSMGIMLGLSSGFGLAFLLEFLDCTFRSRKEVESVLNLPVLVSVPVIQTKEQRRWAKLKVAATVCAILAMSSTLLYALYVLWKNNRWFLPIPL
jgi:polysaccharide chain length determinant protein (PEP-CTERM system associated)